MQIKLYRNFLPDGQAQSIVRMWHLSTNKLSMKQLSNIKYHKWLMYRYWSSFNLCSNSMRAPKIIDFLITAKPGTLDAQEEEGQVRTKHDCPAVRGAASPQLYDVSPFCPGGQGLTNAAHTCSAKGTLTLIWFSVSSSVLYYERLT